MSRGYLYHIRRIDEYTDHLIPTVPKNIGTGEENTIPRICLAPDIERCIGSLNCTIQPGEYIYVYEIPINMLDLDYLYSPIQNQQWVPDAKHYREYWYTSDLQIKPLLYQIVSYNIDYTINWDYLNTETLYTIYKKESKTLNCLELKPLTDEISEDYYNRLYNKAYKDNNFLICDTLWELLIEIPWAQVYSIKDLKIERISK